MEDFENDMESFGRNARDTAIKFANDIDTYDNASVGEEITFQDFDNLFNHNDEF
jgi:hypothetical protein